MRKLWNRLCKWAEVALLMLWAALDGMEEPNL
jgi:hypothetical protein